MKTIVSGGRREGLPGLPVDLFSPASRKKGGGEVIPTEVEEVRFLRGATENRRFWSRFRERPDLHGCSVLELGCGAGALSMEAAQAGASRVVGIDLRQGAIDFARRRARETPGLEGRVEFHACHLATFPSERFDVILSKDTFEHVLDLGDMLAELRQRLQPGGRLYAGFGPLYPSPYGDHDRRRVLLKDWGILGKSLAAMPWGHLMLGKTLVRKHNSVATRQAQSLRELGLNMLAFSDYEKLIGESGLEVVSFDVNRGKGLSPRIFTTLRRIPALRDLCTYNIYCVLRNPG